MVYSGLQWSMVVPDGLCQSLATLWWPTVVHGHLFNAPEHSGHQGYSCACLPQVAYAHEVPMFFSRFPSGETEAHVPKADDCLIAKKYFSTSWREATRASRLQGCAKCFHLCTESRAINLSAPGGGCRERGRDHKQAPVA